MSAKNCRMNNRVVILYSTVDGHTIRICKKISEKFQNHGFAVD